MGFCCDISVVVPGSIHIKIVSMICESVPLPTDPVPVSGVDGVLAKS